MKIAELILDEHLLQDLKAFMIEQLTEQGVKDMYEGNDVSAYPKARTAIEMAFDVFEDLSGRNKDKPKVTESSSR